jgi:hypothetical protein
MKLSLLPLVVLFVAACQTGPPVKTPSGRPEVVVPNATPKEVRAYIIDRGLGKGWTLERDTEDAVTLTRRSDSVTAQLLLGSTYDPNVIDRARFTIIPQGSGTKVYLTEELVTNHGSAFERVTPLGGNKNYTGLQTVLESIKQHFAKT